MPLCVLARPHPQTPDEHRVWTRGGIAVIVGACVAVAVLGAAVTAGPVRSWYPGLTKPSWTPPDWVFAPVWSLLYLMMATAAVRVWLVRDRDDVCCPLTAFAVQLAANLAWPVLFFGLRNPLLGLIDALVLWLSVGVTTAHFFGVSRLAGGLMAPYWVWVGYAAALNAAIVFAPV